MAGYKQAIVTDAGRNLRNAVIYEGRKMEFTRFVLGDGTYADKSEAALRAMTTLISPKNEYEVNSITEVDSDTVKLKFLVTNFSTSTGESIVDEDYYANEIGLFAREVLSSGRYGNEILYSVTVCDGNVGDCIMAFNGHNPLQVVETMTCKNVTAANVTINVEGAYALEESLETETAARIESDFKNLYSLCTKTTTISTVSGNKQITEVGDGVTAVTTIVQTSETVKTITTAVTPDDGDYDYTKTTVITRESSSTTVNESYLRRAKV